jgi:amidohydrolase
VGAGPVTAAAEVRRRVGALAGELLALSHDLAAHPEPAFAEHRSARCVAEAAQRYGLRVRRPAYGLPTAFAATAGDRGPHVVLLAEYDALPGLGHACGHNLIAAAGLGAAAALAPLTHRLAGRVTLLGTPAEEGGGGKILLARRGAFAGAAAAMMVHPDAYEAAQPRIVAAVPLRVTAHGRAAHASLFPERGVNALDALVLGYLGLATLRQHLPAGQRVHGIITSGGEAPNIVPERATAQLLLRAATTGGLGPLARRIEACFGGAARGVGARADVRVTGPVYAEMRPNAALAAAYARHARALGRRPLPLAAMPPTLAGSSDIGNVSLLLPAIHPKLAVGDGRAMPHSREFAAAAVSPSGDRAVLDGAVALALTAVDVWTDAGLREAMSRGAAQVTRARSAG